MKQLVIDIRNGVTRMPEWRLARPVDFTLLEGEHVAIVGRNGAGKSMLADMLTGKHPLAGEGVCYNFAPSSSTLVSDNVRHITFRDNYGGDSDHAYFLQQRWNQTEIDPETPTVGQLLEEAFRLHGGNVAESKNFQLRLYDMFGMSLLLDKPIVLLSSGEMRKFQIIRALLGHPRVLIMDNPFIGLDAETRTLLSRLLAALANDGWVQMVLVISKFDDIPGFITHVVEVSDGVVGKKIPFERYMASPEAAPSRVLPAAIAHAILDLPEREVYGDSDEVVVMDHVSIRYGTRTILKDLDWTVRRGELWALQGCNGAGKSTLLSLVCADNPQGYACDIRLFGHQRGSGESIWDIKRNIGYVSPEMHRAYRRDMPALRIVASGMHDSIGLYVKPTYSDLEVCRFWMKVFGLEGMEERSYLKLSSGEQRLVLLARAFVKDPQLLILDEPFHGLDNFNRQRVKDVIEIFCQRRGKTLIMISHYEEEFPPCITHHLTLRKQE